MSLALRFAHNPILTPSDLPWEKNGSFNGCPIQSTDGYHMLYRAQSTPLTIESKTLELSTIGHAISFDRVSYLNRRQLISPTEPWEKFGCEDPRITQIDDTFYISYTALSQWPPAPSGISVGIATTKDFFTIDHKFHATPFNSKALTLFPEKINNKFAALITANSDLPPSTIGIAYVDSLSDLWNHSFWNDWYKSLPSHALSLLRTTHDHVEIGAPPLLIREGWLIIYSYIKSYNTSHKFFGIEAVIVDKQNPQKILKRMHDPILFPEMEYERAGNIANVIFPTGAVIHNDTLGIYYGAADTTTCLATCSVEELCRLMEVVI